jgi:pullulanase/glycogen debranching enzyme
MMFSKRGEHNTYDRPDLNRLDWGQTERHRKLVEAIAGLVELRRRSPHFRHTQPLLDRASGSKDWDIDWIFPNGFPHADNVNALAFRLRAPRHVRRWKRIDDLLVLLNGSRQGADFTLPAGTWRTLADGHGLVVDLDGLGAAPARGHYYVHPGTGAVLAPAR